jgi:hypothetical protein
VLNEERDTEALDFISRHTNTYYHLVGGVLAPARSAFKAIHQVRHRRQAKESERDGTRSSASTGGTRV